MKAELIRMRIEPDLKEKAQKQAEKNYETLSSYITRLIVQDLKNTENEA